jgi:phage shock protein A
MFKIFKAAKDLVKAKDREAAQAIEDGNVLGFAQNDLEDIENDRNKVLENIGHIKGRISVITDEITDLTEQITNNTSKAEQLIAKAEGLTDQKKTDAEALAQQMCAQVETLEKKKTVQELALKSQKDLLIQQEAVSKELDEAYEQCKNDMELMKTQKDVTDANKSMKQIDTGSAQSAVAKFKERRKKMNEQLATSKAMAEQTQEHSKTLDQKADELLGKSKGSDLFEKMKAKRNQTPAA